MITLFKVHMPKEATEAASEVLMSGYIGQGAKVSDFEEKLQPITGTKLNLAVNACTSAIHMALRMAGAGPGTEVITTPMTCTATNVPILERGAKIVWADINPRTGCIDPKSVREKITDKTAAVLCVHWAGYPCDLDELNEIAHSHGAAVIEDAAHALGATYKGKMIGSISDYTCFSFQAIKQITTGDGGLLTCASEEEHERGKLLRWYGLDREKKSSFRCEADIVEFGYKFHMNDIAASIGLTQLPYVDGIIARARDNASYYDSELKGVPGVSLLEYESDRESAYWLYTLLVEDRESFVEYMTEKGVMVSRTHRRNDDHTMVKDFRCGNLPGVDEFDDKQINIPVGWWVTDEDRKHIVDSIKEWAK